MLCAKCQKRNATVHHTIIDGDKLEKIDLCVACAGPILREEKSVQVAKLLNVFHVKSEMNLFKPESEMSRTACDTLAEPIDPKAGYPLEAYEFVGEALDFCQSAGAISGRELLDSIRVLALRKFGTEAKAVLGNWKIFATEDFWNIIAVSIALSGTELLAKRFQGSLEEFQNGFNFDKAFPEE
jgi:uncharacterized repeat protein (TIGR04138 family)